MEMWRRRRKAAALYSVYSGLYLEAVVSSVASAVALVEVGRFREAVEYVQRAAKALYEAAKDVFEHVKITVQRLVELFVEAVARVLTWIDEHKAYLFLMAAAASGAVALAAALNMWGMIELEKLAYVASLTPFIPAGVEKYSREEVFNILRSATDPYEKFKDIAKAAIAKNEELAEPWESLWVLIGKAHRELDEGKKKALFYATLALEEAFGVYRSALREYAEVREKAVQRVEVGEGPFNQVVYAADLEKTKQLAEEEGKAFEKALEILRGRLNEYAVKYSLRDLLDVNEDVARRLAEAKKAELSEFNDVSFGVKALAALMAYREYALERRGAYGIAAGYWLEVGGSAQLLYHAPSTAYLKAEKAGVERPAAVEELVAEALRRLFLKPGVEHHSGLVEELTKVGKLALMPEKTKSSYVFRLFRLEEGGGLVDLGIKLRISKVEKGERASITYALTFDDVERRLVFFGQELETAERAAEEVGGRLPVEDRLPYMLGWVDSDVAISGGLLEMGTSHLWQLAETHALFGWPYISVHRVGLTLEGPKPQFRARTPLKNLDKAIESSAKNGWLRMLGTKAGLEDIIHVKSWDDLKRWVAKNWDIVVNAAVKRLGEGVRSELEALRDKLNDDKIAREVVAPALLLIQAERLGVNETTLRYLGAVISGAMGGDGHVSAAMEVVGLTSGEREIALLWAAALAAHGFRTKARKVGGAFIVDVSGGDAVKLARLYFLYGPPLLEGDERIINHKLTEAVELGAKEPLDIRWEGLRRTDGGNVAADLIISEASIAVKYNVYLSENAIKLQFQSSDQSRAELAARLLRLAGIDAEVKKEGGRDVWRIEATIDKLAAGREELRKALAEIVKVARKSVGEEKAKRWLEKLEEGRVLMEGWPKYHVALARSGALVVRFSSTDPDSIKQGAQRFREMGLEEGKHFTMKMPEGGRYGYVRILKEGLAHAAWLSVHGTEEQRKLAARFVERILRRAEEAGEEVRKKAEEIVKEGKERGSLTLEGFEKKVEVNGNTYVVKVIGGEAVEEDRDGRKLLRIKIKAEVGRVEGEHIVDRVVREYTITFGRYDRNNVALGFAYARTDAPGGRKADAEKFAAVVEALTGKKPRIRRRSDGTIELKCDRDHLDGFARFAELAEAIVRWLAETGR